MNYSSLGRLRSYFYSWYYLIHTSLLVRLRFWIYRSVVYHLQTPLTSTWTGNDSLILGAGITLRSRTLLIISGLGRDYLQRISSTEFCFGGIWGFGTCRSPPVCFAVASRGVLTERYGHGRPGRFPSPVREAPLLPPESEPSTGGKYSGIVSV